MKNNIKFNNSKILYTFSSVNGKYTVELTYEFINQYQLQNTSIKVSSFCAALKISPCVAGLNLLIIVSMQESKSN